MKKNRLFILFFLMLSFISFFPTMAHARVAEWVDLELDEFYTLKQSITFPQLDEIKSGEKVEVRNLINTGPPFMYFEVKLLKCKKPDQTFDDIIMVNPSPMDETRDRSARVLLKKGCLLSIWVDSRDFYTESLFHYF